MQSQEDQRLGITFHPYVSKESEALSDQARSRSINASEREQIQQQVIHVRLYQEGAKLSKQRNKLRHAKSRLDEQIFSSMSFAPMLDQSRKALGLKDSRENFT